jgi:hypothetical protein
MQASGPKAPLTLVSTAFSNSFLNNLICEFVQNKNFWVKIHAQAHDLAGKGEEELFLSFYAVALKFLTGRGRGL